MACAHVLFVVMTVDTSCISVEVVQTTKHYNLASQEPGWGYIHPTNHALWLGTSSDVEAGFYYPLSKKTNHAHIVIPSMGLMLVGNSMLCSASTDTGPDASKLGLSSSYTDLTQMNFVFLILQ